MIGRRALLSGISSSSLIPLSPFAQTIRPRTKEGRFRIGLLAASDDSSRGGFLFEALREGLRTRGYQEGQNLEFIIRRPDQNDPAALALAARELTEAALDVLVAPTTSQVNAARNATQSSPIVMVAVAAPVELGLIADVSRPGRNVTGLANNTLGLLAKHASLIRELLKGSLRVGFLLGTSNPLRQQSLKIIEELSSQIGIAVVILSFSTAEEIDSLIEQAASAKQINAIVIVADNFAYLQRERIAKVALRNGLPIVSGYREAAIAGSLLAYGANLSDLYRRAAGFIDRILQGDDPATIPVEYPTRYDFLVNLKTARALALEIPPSILARADELIE